MNAAEAFAEACRRGMRLAPDGECVLVHGRKGDLTADLRSAIIQNKPELLALLNGEDGPAPTA